MSNVLIPWKTLSATVSLSQDSEDWTLATLPDPWPENGDGTRTYIHHVIFESGFEYPPVIHLGLVGFDVDQRASARIKLTTPLVTSVGFTVEITTWLNSKVYAVDFSWMAVGA